ncbi:MAG: GNAT family N-acetyltransferase [Treponema sp.]|nr:GNAT family N-acetyltransferase [Treponema sp.]
MWAGRSLPQWKRLGQRSFYQAEDLLRRREPYCVSACARFLDMARFSDCLWGFRDGKGSINALLLYSKQTLLPVFPVSEAGVRPSRPMLRFLTKGQFHAIQGLRRDILTMEEIMTGLGRKSVEPIDYDLMALEWGPIPETLRAGPPGLIIRTPESRELENVLPLQAAYEKEEVLPQGSSFSMAVCRMNLEHIFKGQQILVAELGGRIVAKANTSAFSFTRAQIGGVFVLPDHRGRGIARRLCAELAGLLKKSGWSIGLFVKKRNCGAQKAYRSIGFKPIADYRISYY